MQENKQIYSQQIESLKVALTNSDTRIEIEAENVFEMKTQLMRLKHYGQNLQSILGRLDNICICNIYKPILRFDKYLDGIQIGRSVHRQRQRVTVRRRSGSQEDSRTLWNRIWVKFGQYFWN